MTDDDAGQPHAADRCFIFFVVVFLWRLFSVMYCRPLSPSTSFTVLVFVFFQRMRPVVPYATRESRMVPQTRGGKKPCRPDA